MKSKRSPTRAAPRQYGSPRRPILVASPHARRARGSEPRRHRRSDPDRTRLRCGNTYLLQRPRPRHPSRRQQRASKARRGARPRRSRRHARRSCRERLRPDDGPLATTGKERHANTSVPCTREVSRIGKDEAPAESMSSTRCGTASSQSAPVPTHEKATHEEKKRHPDSPMAWRGPGEHRRASWRQRGPVLDPSSRPAPRRCAAAAGRPLRSMSSLLAGKSNELAEVLR